MRITQACSFFYPRMIHESLPSTLHVGYNYNNYQIILGEKTKAGLVGTVAGLGTINNAKEDLLNYGIRVESNSVIMQ